MFVLLTEWFRQRNHFVMKIFLIPPSQECIKPVEVEKKVTSNKGAKIQVEEDGYCVEENDLGQKKELEKASFTLADCLACSGCITSAETVLRIIS